MDNKQVIHGKYFPHIDGIRTIAVLSVVIYHIFGNLCPGGFVGVDIFFVISGYLITGGILKSLDQGKFSIKDFYERRIRRIIPAYVVLIGFVMLLALVLPSNLLTSTFEASAFSSIFATNFFFPFNTGGYFDLNSEANPLLHLWSLGVEEQFYIFSPVFLFLVYKFKKQLILPSLISVVALSLALSIYCNIRGGNSLNFYMLPTRTWELMAGSLLAYWNKVSPPGKAGGGAIKILGILGIIISIATCYIYNSSTPFPGFTALPPVIATMLMIRWGNAGISRPILESKPFVGIGKISYSLYLWHWPLIVFWKYLSDTPDNPWGLWGVFVLSMILAWLSWRFVEMPVRLSKKWNLKRALLWVIIGCGGIGLVSSILVYTNFSNFWTRSLVGRNYVEDYWKGTPSSLYNSDSINIIEKLDLLNTYPEPLITLGTEQNPYYLLLGDSHAAALASGFHELSKTYNTSGLFINRRSPALWNKEKIPIYLNTITELLSNHPEFKTVIFINRWSINTGEKPNESDHPLHNPSNPNYSLFHDQEKNRRLIFDFEARLREFCSSAKTMNRQVILISSIPEQGIDIPVKSYRNKILGRPSSSGVSFCEYEKRQRKVTKILKDLEQEGLAKILWVDSFFFGKEPYSRISDKNGFPLYLDDDHLNPTGAKELIHFYNDELLRLISPDTENTESKAPPTSPSK